MENQIPEENVKSSENIKPSIDRFVIIGDSLSDTGTMADSIMVPCSGLSGNSPDGRFTNGSVWLEFFRKKVLTDVIKNPIFKHIDDESVAINSSQIYVRTYCEGGMTSHNYDKDPLTNLAAGIKPNFKDGLIANAAAAGARHAVAHLDEMCQKVKQDDKDMVIHTSSRKTTLVIEWSGANDLITVATRPTLHSAELAAHARIENIKKMIEMGYKHFVLFTLPDLSLTPRYQNEQPENREAAEQSVNRLNQIILEQIPELLTAHPDCTIKIYDANALFKKCYNNPEGFGLHEDKKHQPFMKSKAFKPTAVQPLAEGYMFWDDVHPTQTVHQYLGMDFYAMFEQSYTFNIPEDAPIEQFRQSYGRRLANDRSTFFGDLTSRSNIDYKSPDLTHKKILNHALLEGGYRTLDVITSLGWITPNKKLTSFAQAAHLGLDLIMKEIDEAKDKAFFAHKKTEIEIVKVLDVRTPEPEQKQEQELTIAI